MQLDGPDLEELLLRARQEYGSNVHIVKADKVRAGGVGGFFTREQYELTIEVDEPFTGDTTAAGNTTFAGDTTFPGNTERFVANSAPFGGNGEKRERPASLLDLADAISDRETETRHAHSTAYSYSTASSESSTASPLADPATFTPGFSAGPSAGPSLSTDGASFANILAGLTASVAEPTPSASRVTAERAKPATTGAKAAPKPAPKQDREAVVRPTLSRPPARRRSESRPARRTRAEAAPLSPPPMSLQNLRDLGMPAALLPTGDDGDVLGALVAALRQLPTAPALPTEAGDIVALVGEGEGAWDAALQLTHSLGLDDRSLVYVTAGTAPSKVAPARRITALDQLPSRRDRWRRKTTPTIAVVDAPMAVKAARWNRQAITVLQPAAIWAVVPATRKPADVARWVGRLGHTDGLVITDVDASSDPASVLEIGVPVAWLDGRPATPGAWAGLIVDRLVEAR